MKGNIPFPAVTRECIFSWDSFIHSFIQVFLYRLLLLFRGTPDTARMLCRGFTLKLHGKLRVKDLPKIPTWRLERDSNPRRFLRKVVNLPMSYHAPQLIRFICSSIFT